MNAVRTGKLYFLDEEIRYIDSWYRVQCGERDEVLCGICVGTSMYDIWVRAADIAEMIEW